MKFVSFGPTMGAPEVGVGEQEALLAVYSGGLVVAWDCFLGEPAFHADVGTAAGGSAATGRGAACELSCFDARSGPGTRMLLCVANAAGKAFVFENQWHSAGARIGADIGGGGRGTSFCNTHVVDMCKAGDSGVAGSPGRSNCAGGGLSYEDAAGPHGAGGLLGGGRGALGHVLCAEVHPAGGRTLIVVVTSANVAVFGCPVSVVSVSLSLLSQC
jgi:hypothetical protein